MLADDEADDHQRNGNADGEGCLPAVNTAFGRALVFRQFNRQCGYLRLGDDQRQEIFAPGQDQDEKEGCH